MMRVVSCVAAMGCACLALTVLALTVERASSEAPSYPDRPVTVVVPYAGGGVADLFARLLAPKLEQRLGKPFVIENKSDANAVQAATTLAHAAPDGHTIMIASSSLMALNVTVRKTLAYDPTTDLAPVALLARVPFVLVVNPVLPMQSVSDLVKLAKEKPGQLTYATPGGGTLHHLNAEMFKRAFGLDIIHVPYKGTRSGLNDLIAGHITMMFTDVPPALPLIAAGKLRALGVTTVERVPAAPDIPPLADAGMAGYDMASWHMVVAPGQVAKEIVDRLNGEIRTIMSDPVVQHDLIRDGTIPQATPSADELKDFVKSEITRWGRLVQQAGLAGSQ